jgi:endoglycosylceramidase
MKMEFHRKTGQFQFYYRANPSIPYPTEIFIPHLQYPNGHYIVAEGTEITSDENAQLVWLRALKSAEIRVTIQRK